MSLDVCWSLRWRTVRDAAPDNDSARPFSAKLQQHAGIKRQSGAQAVFCARCYCSVMWGVGGLEGGVCQSGSSLGILAGCIHTHTHAHFRALPPLTHAVFPLLLDELRLSECDQKQPPRIFPNPHLPKTLQRIFWNVTMR